MKRLVKKKLWHKLAIIVLSATLLGGCTLLDRTQVGGLQVITGDATSSLFLDGQYLDKTPYINKELKPGVYTLRIEPDKPTLTPHELQLTVRKGLLTAVTWNPGERPETSGGVMYELEPIQGNMGELAFITIPDNTLVRLDQGEQQFAPVTLTDIEPGLHQFQISLPAYKEQQHTINVIKGHRITITAKLAQSQTATANQPAIESQTDETATNSADTNTIYSAASNSARAASQSSQIRLEAEVTVLITNTQYFHEGKEVLRVRNTASSVGEEIGFAEVGQRYPYTGKSQQGWYQIEFDGQMGWVSSEYAQLEQ